MRLAIISDIHGNLEALEKALEIIATKNIDEIICLGDIVGYGASPNECVELLLKHTSYILLGNHDQAAVHIESAEYFNPYARTAIEWTHKTLNSKNIKILKELPYTLERHNVLFVHSSPRQPDHWYYITNQTQAHQNFPYFTQQLCFVGHSHIPDVYCDDDWTREVNKGQRFIVNVGSIGQPRDHNNKLSFGIFDTITWKYENVRETYDIDKSSAKIYRAGLPAILGDRLFQGK